MNILIASPYALCTPHFETELELMQLALDAGHDVTYLSCDASFPICEFNYYHDLYRCKLCIRMRERGLNLLSKRVERRPFLSIQSDQLQFVNTFIQNELAVNRLESLFIDNFDIGLGVKSSVVSFLRNPDLELDSHLCAGTIDRFVVASAQVYFSMLNHLSSNKFKLIYLFNGRFAMLRAVMRACEKKGADFVIHERGANYERYQLYNNVLPHSIINNTKLMINSWNEATGSPTDRDRLGAEFYEGRSKGHEDNWYSFTADQNQDLMPDNWDESKNNLVIYVSSEDEFVAIGDEFKNHIYSDQNQGIRKIIDDLSDRSDLQIYVRVHPNLKNVRNSQTDFLKSLNFDNVTVIAADSPISSYLLMRKASKVLTFGSTTGIEATFWGTPSILAGRSLYQGLDGTYNPETHDEVVRLILSDIPPKPKTGALMYGYYCMTRGTPFKYFQATGFFSGKFQSQQDMTWHSLTPRPNPLLARLTKGYFLNQLAKLKRIISS